MEMITTLGPHIPTPASGTVHGETSATRSLSVAPAAQNTGFYFRNWPFPVDASEQSWNDSQIRTWQEKLTSYRKAIMDRHAEKAESEERDAAKASPADGAATDKAAPPPGSGDARRNAFLLPNPMEGKPMTSPSMRGGVEAASVPDGRDTGLTPSNTTPPA